jgi:predicted alpha/beta-fold hydrolase
MAQFWSQLVLGMASATVVFSASQARAARADFSDIASSEIRVLSPDDCREDFVKSQMSHHSAHAKLPVLAEKRKSNLIGLNFLSWVPDGTSDYKEPAGCEPERIERLFLNARGSTERQAAALRDFFKRCDSDLRYDAPVGFEALFNTTETEYQICDHPNMRKVIIRTPSGDVIRGMLALKPGATTRPLVISKCGVLCNSGDASMRTLLMHLYDEGPFNVLALANNSGSDFVRDNGYFAPGGYQEGQQVIEVAKLVRNGAIGKHTSSIHFVGMSLGGHAALFTSYINQFNPTVAADGTEGSLFSSTLAACPVVDLHESIETLFSTPIKSSIARLMFDNAAADVVKSIPGLGFLFKPWENLETSELPAEIARQSADHYRSRHAGWQIAPFQNTDIHSADEYWKENQFLELAKHPIKTPTLVLAAEDDQIVVTEKNAKLLERLVAGVRRSLANVAGAPTENLDSVVIPSGNHCAFSQIYGWKTSSALFRSYVISNSPDLVARRHVAVAHFNSQLDRDAREDEVWEGTQRYTSTFRFKKGVEKLFVTTSYINGSSDSTGGIGRCGGAVRTMDDACFTDVEMELPFSALSPRPSWAHAPSTDVEAEGLTRWANVQMKLLSKSGGLLEETTQDAAQLRWVSYEN